MTRNYWDQWGKKDLDSWQGKGSIDYQDDFHEESLQKEETSYRCGYYCFDCLGISWHDFM